MDKSVLIVGTGLAGLASALRLSTKGYHVTLIEKNKEAGGRLNRVRQDGFTFDAGPTFFSMSYEFERFARECGIALPFESSPVDPLYRVHLQGYKEPFVLHRNIQKLAGEFEKYEPGFINKMEHYLRHTGQIFDDTVDIAVQQNFRSIPHYISQLAKVNKIHIPTLTGSFSDYVNQHFCSSEARQIISLPSYFLGTTPENTNGIYSLLSYTEFVHDGYHNVKGGMYEIVNGLMNELRKRNIEIIFDSEIVDYKSAGKRINGLIDQNGRIYEADHYLINMDAALFRGRILRRRAFSEEHLKRKKWSMGFLTIYIGLDSRLEEVDLHNYYIGMSEPEKTMKGFRDTHVPQNPYFYVNIPSKYNQGYAPEGCEAVMIVVPVPNLLYKTEWNDTERIIENILNEFSARTHFPILKHIKSLNYYTPYDWQTQFNLYMGAGLGLTHSMTQTGILRPRNEDETFKNLFYTGASTTPGIGLPMAIISSRLSTEQIEKRDGI